MTMKENQVCTVRWSGAFMCEFGEFIGEHRKRDELQKLVSQCNRGLDWLEYTTTNINGVTKKLEMI